MNYPLKITFNSTSRYSGIGITDNSGAEVLYVVQKSLAIKEVFEVFTDRHKKELLFKVKAKEGLFSSVRLINYSFFSKNNEPIGRLLVPEQKSSPANDSLRVLELSDVFFGSISKEYGGNELLAKVPFGYLAPKVLSQAELVTSFDLNNANKEKIAVLNKHYSFKESLSVVEDHGLSKIDMNSQLLICSMLAIFMRAFRYKSYGGGSTPSAYAY